MQTILINRSDFTLATLVMGISYSRLGNTKASERCFDEVIRYDKDNTVALTALSMLHFDAGRYNQAIHYADLLLAAHPDHMLGLRLRSRILLEMGCAKESASDVKRLKKESETFARFDTFVQALPEDSFDDTYGTISQKITLLEEKIFEEETPENLMALSLCCLFSGDTDKAIDYLFQIKK